MATLTIDKTGNAAVYVLLPDGKRRPVRLGKVGQQRAERMRGYIGELESARLKGVEPDVQARAWLGGVKGTLRARLAACGLCEADNGTAASGGLGAFIDGYIAQRVDAKPNTMISLVQARRHLVRFLGETKPVDRVTPTDADAFRAELLGRGRSRATVAKWCGYGRHFFEVAKRRRIIADNPFAHIKGTVKGNPARRVFVKAADALKVIDAAPDPQWKLLIALARFGGLRIPSEALALTWGDVDFENKRFTVRASKTEHHAGGGVRVVPMFPELEPLFQAVYDDAAPGDVNVITRYRDPAANLRTQLVRYVTAAGLTPWAKPWQNLRSSRATELADSFPSHVCAAWLGHTEAVADEFYRQVTDDHFARAVVTQVVPVRNPVRAGGASDRTERADPRAERREPHVGALETAEVGAAGIEPATLEL